jgi:hypothetical protein
MAMGTKSRGWDNLDIACCDTYTTHNIHNIHAAHSQHTY